MRILGIDFSALWHRNWSATGGQELSEAHARTLRTVAEIREGYDRVALLCDSRGPSWRRSIYPLYKAEREEKPAPFYEQMRRTLDRLAGEGCVAFAAPAYGEGCVVEADDLCASLAAWCEANDHDLVLFGGDKDLLQLVRPGVAVWRPDHGVPYDRARVMGDPKIGVEPARIPDWLALGGDRSDGFKLFDGWEEGGKRKPGIGPKNAAQLIAKFGTIFGVVDAAMAPDVEGESPVFPPSHVREVIRRARPTPLDAATLGLRLATLISDLPIDWSPLREEPVYAPIAERAEPNDVLESDEPEMIVDGDDRTTALARVESGGIDRYAMQPRSFSDMQRMADQLYESRLYGQYPNSAAIFAVMLEANERGVPVGLALRNAYVVRGKPTWSAAFLAALVLGSPRCKVFRIVESTTERAVLEYQRTDEPTLSVFVFTIAEARAAGWEKSGEKGDNKWITNPRTMLRWAAIREAARAYFPDVTCGMYTPDELEGA